MKPGLLRNLIFGALFLGNFSLVVLTEVGDRHWVYFNNNVSVGFKISDFATIAFIGLTSSFLLLTACLFLIRKTGSSLLRIGAFSFFLILFVYLPDYLAQRMLQWAFP